jgi:hypothetical protein
MPENRRLEHSNHYSAEWRPKRFHVQKQVVQLGAEKKHPQN